MGRALPEDEAIEAKMVTKAIERAQTTVEQRNAEIRKNVLKYDEVMNEQRKVIYRRRDQILDGEDLKSAALEYLAEAIGALISRHCVADASDEWDLPGLVQELQSYYPSEVTQAALEQCHGTDEMSDLVVEEASRYYDQREEQMTTPVMREVERQVMLRIIDQRWREHLVEMDYLQEGINLRAMGQKDPLVEWQREGFEMFGQLMKGIADDFVRYMMHVQVVQEQAQPAVVQNVRTSAPELGGNAFAAARAAGPLEEESAVPADQTARTAQTVPARQQTVVKDEFAKTGRNEPCPCGSGKKFKMCHGKAG
jgi:preprotein translocase subunit SecA